jgi:predicted DNA-binding transcriptional regulator AlpA
VSGKPKKKLQTRDLIARYGICDKSVDRWVAAGILPEPIYINHRRYWDEDEVEQCERDRMAARKTTDTTDTTAA